MLTPTVADVAAAYVRAYETPKADTAWALDQIAQQYPALGLPTRYSPTFDRFADALWEIECDGTTEDDIAHLLTHPDMWADAGLPTE